MRVLFDTNVVLDVLLDREPHAEIAAQLLSLVDSGRLDGVLCATTVTTIHYLASKATTPGEAARQVRELLAMFAVAPVDEGVLASALDLGLADYEDAVLHEAAAADGASAIVTRNGRDFMKATLPVFDPGELLAAVAASE
ncbi:MAG: PIN domain-containing protein [Anaerosomatales bacterium]|nr:PIN domain-containing protein [Coriobacteriia bacterium]